MDPVLLIGQYPYSHWVLGTRPGGIESYRPLPQLGVLPCDRGNIGGSPWLSRFITNAVLNPKKKMGHFTKNWSLELATEVEDLVRDHVSNSQIAS